MGNSLLTPPEIDPRQGPHLASGEVFHLSENKEENVFSSLWGSLRDVLFPVKLPPLVLESKPIPVVDRMKTKQNPAATGSAIAIYALIFLLVAWLLKKHVQFAAPVKTIAAVDLSIPPKAPPRAQAMGGGGGQRGPTPVTKGTPPKFADTADRSAQGSADGRSEDQDRADH